MPPPEEFQQSNLEAIAQSLETDEIFAGGDFTFMDASIRLCINSEALLDDVKDYLSPIIQYSNSEGPTQALWEIRAFANSDLAKLNDLLAGIWEDSKTVNLYSNGEQQGKYARKAEFQFLQNRMTGCIYVWDMRRKRCFLCGGSGRSFQQEIYRLIRELLVRAAERRGVIRFHAAACESNEQGIMICGPKRAGKTTILMSFLSRGYAFVSSDRVLLKPVRDTIKASGIPQDVSILPRTISSIPDLAYFGEARFPLNAFGKKEIRPTWLAEELGIALRTSGINLRDVIIAQSSETQKSKFSRITSRETAIQQLTECFMAIDKHAPDFQDFAAVSPQLKHDSLKRVISNLKRGDHVRFWCLRVGTDFNSITFRNLLHRERF